MKAKGTGIGELVGGLREMVEPPGGWEAHDARIQAERDAAENEKRQAAANIHREALVTYGVPAKDVERICVDGLKPTDALASLQRLEESMADDYAKSKPVLVLSGGVGCGKTTAAAWWLSQPGPFPRWPRNLLEPMFIPVFRLERASRYDDDKMRAIEKARRLVIDDLGTEYDDKNENFRTLLRGVFDSRYLDWLPLVITTNLSLDDFRERYGERTFSRLKEIGRFVELDAPDLRGKKL